MSNAKVLPLFVFIFVLFSLQLLQYKLKSLDGVLGIRTRGRRMVGADDTTAATKVLFENECFKIA